MKYRESNEKLPLHERELLVSKLERMTGFEPAALSLGS